MSATNSASMAAFGESGTGSMVVGSTHLFENPLLSRKSENMYVSKIEESKALLDLEAGSGSSDSESCEDDAIFRSDAENFERGDKSLQRQRRVRRGALVAFAAVLLLAAGCVGAAFLELECMEPVNVALGRRGKQVAEEPELAEEGLSAGAVAAEEDLGAAAAEEKAVEVQPRGSWLAGSKNCAVGSAVCCIVGGVAAGMWGTWPTAADRAAHAQAAAAAKNAAIEGKALQQAKQAEQVKQAKVKAQAIVKAENVGPEEPQGEGADGENAEAGVHAN